MDGTSGIILGGWTKFIVKVWESIPTLSSRKRLMLSGYSCKQFPIAGQLVLSKKLLQVTCCRGSRSKVSIRLGKESNLRHLLPAEERR